MIVEQLQLESEETEHHTFIKTYNRVKNSLPTELSDLFKKMVQRSIVENDTEDQKYKDIVNLKLEFSIQDLSDEAKKLILKNNNFSDFGEIRPFEVIVVDTEDSDYKEKAALLDYNFNSLHTSRIKGQEPIIFLEKFYGKSFIKSSLAKEGDKNKIKNLVLHEFYHTQREISNDWIGLTLEELLAESFSPNMGSYADIKELFRNLVRLFDLQEDILTKAMFDKTPSSFILETVSKKSPILACLLSFYIPVHYRKAFITDMGIENYPQNIDEIIIKEAKRVIPQGSVDLFFANSINRATQIQKNRNEGLGLNLSLDEIIDQIYIDRGAFGGKIGLENFALETKKYK